jgi:hypothetical protein
LTIDAAKGNYIGFSGKVTGTINTLNLTNIAVTGNNYTAGIAGYDLYGTISNNSVSGSVVGANYTGLINGYSYNSGANVVSNTAQGNVTGADYVGGLAGFAGAISNLRGIYKGGSVTATGTHYGRIVGDIDGYSSAIALSSITVNGSTVSSTSNTNTNGLGISSLDDAFKNINVAELALDTYIGGDESSDGYYWDYDGTGTLIMKNTTTNPLTFSLSGAGTTASPYLINNATDLHQAALQPSKVFKLMADINMSGIEHYMLGSYVNNFSGTFLGNAHTISNLTIDAAKGNYIGFSGKVAGTITGLKMTGVSISGGNYTGGVAGYDLRGTISDIVFTGNVSGANYTGMINGYSYNSGASVINILAQGSVTGADYVGGLAGTVGAIATLKGINQGGSVNATGTHYGRIAGDIDGNSTSLALTSVTVNGSTVSSTSTGSVNGANIIASDLQNQTTYTNIGFNFTDETKKSIWFLSGSSADFRNGASS